MKLLCDTREQAPLEFPKMSGVEVIRQGLSVGDYAALHQEGSFEWRDTTIFERKGLGDLFTSFTSHYDHEKNKWNRAHAEGLQYILAVEGTASEVLKGHTYWSQGQLHQTQKSGLAQLRQLLSILRRYHIPIWFCASRKEMALLIVEYFLAAERFPKEMIRL